METPRFLKTYVENKRSNVNTRKQAPQNYAACYVCANKELPPDLNKHISDSENSKTCEQVHLDLLSSNGNSEICAAKQILYRDICCKAERSPLSGPSQTAFMAVLGAFAFCFVVKRLKVACKSDKVSPESSTATSYEIMDINDEEKSARSRTSSRRSRKTKSTKGNSQTKTRGRSKSVERGRSKSVERGRSKSVERAKKPSKKIVLKASDESFNGNNSITADSTMAVFQNQVPTQVV